MKNLLLALAAAVGLCIAAANAQGFNLQAIQQQLSANPTAQAATQQAQQAVMQQALKQAAANPQLLTQMAGSLSSTQQATLMQQALVIGQQIFTPAEQAKLTQFTATPEGASIVSKLPLFAQQMAPTVLQMYAQSAGAAGK